jgi:hypothetical protein
MTSACEGQSYGSVFTITGDIEGCTILRINITSVTSMIGKVTGQVSQHPIFVIRFTTTAAFTYLIINLTCRYLGGQPKSVSFGSLPMNRLNVRRSQPSSFTGIAIIYEDESISTKSDNLYLQWDGSSNSYTLYLPSSVGISLTGSANLIVNNDPLS